KRTISISSITSNRSISESISSRPRSIRYPVINESFASKRFEKKPGGGSSLTARKPAKEGKCSFEVFSAPRRSSFQETPRAPGARRRVRRRSLSREQRRRSRIPRMEGGAILASRPIRRRAIDPHVEVVAVRMAVRGLHQDGACAPHHGR